MEFYRGSVEVQHLQARVARRLTLLIDGIAYRVVTLPESGPPKVVLDATERTIALHPHAMHQEVLSALALLLSPERSGRLSSLD